MTGRIFILVTVKLPNHNIFRYKLIISRLFIIAFFEGLAKPHDHVGPLDLYSCNSDACLNEVRQYQTGDKINFSALATRYPITVVKSGEKSVKCRADSKAIPNRKWYKR